MFEQIHFHRTQRNLKRQESELNRALQGKAAAPEVGCADRGKVRLPFDQLGIEIDPEDTKRSSLDYLC